MTELTTDQVAVRYGVDRSTVRRWCLAGLLPNARRLGTNNRATWMILAHDLAAFVRPKLGRRGKYEPGDIQGKHSADGREESDP